MKSILTALALLAIAFTLPAAPEAPGLFDAGRFNVSPFAALKVTEASKTTGKWGGGVALSYSVVDNIDVEVSALSYKLTDSPVVESFDEGSATFKGYLPIGKTGLAGYGLIGYTRDHPEDKNFADFGAGLELRSERFRAFVEGKYETSFQFEDKDNRFQLRIGGGLSF